MHAKLILAGLALAACTLSAQTSAPDAAQAVPGANAPVAAQAAAAGPNVTVQAALQAIQAMKAANDEILKRQAATLLQLEEMEKAAAQIKIYSKRG